MGSDCSRLGLALTVVALGAALGVLYAQAQDTGPTGSRPNILWLVSEDNGPHLGAYGDRYATTPNLDALAERGFRYRTVWSNAPVCAAARSTLITGVFPAAAGGEHHRSRVQLPPFLRLYPALLRQAGYYTTNNSKTDYNFPMRGDEWDESSSSAHYRNRRADQPFFAVFNIGSTHESQIRTRPHTWTHDIGTVPVPPYMPNVRETREDWAQYHDRMTEMDQIVGERLRELATDGLADETIVMYYGDHGPGLPRSKRQASDSGLRVPLIVYVPPGYASFVPQQVRGGNREVLRLVSFVDFAPTLLSLAGVRPPEWMQGRAFLGEHVAPAPAYLFGFRGRMDERYDMVRSVRDERHVYVRNYLPHRPSGQHVAYMFQTPTTVAWKQLFDRGELPDTQAAFWKPRPSEELYDLETDPYELRNLAGSGAHRDVLDRFRAALDAHLLEVRDVGVLPEYELHRDGPTPWDRGQGWSEETLRRLHAVARTASDTRTPVAVLRQGLADPDPIVRYWSATGMVIRGAEAVGLTTVELERLLGDTEPGPRIAAAEALGRFGPARLRGRAIDVLLTDGNAEAGNVYVALLALNALNQIPELPPDVLSAVRALPETVEDGPDGRATANNLRLLKQAIQDNVR